MRACVATRVDAFDTTTVIVPNRNIATYLKFEIARRTGVLANFRFEYLYRFFRDAIVDDDIQILGRDDLHTLLLDVLYDDALLGDPDLGAVRSYLDVATEPDARHRRVWQLGAELARSRSTPCRARACSTSGRSARWSPTNVTSRPSAGNAASAVRQARPCPRGRHAARTAARADAGHLRRWARCRALT